MAQETCPQCSAAVRFVEHENHFEIDCTVDASHYSAHRRKPGAAFLWSADLHITEQTAQLLLLEAV